MTKGIYSGLYPQIENSSHTHLEHVSLTTGPSIIPVKVLELFSQAGYTFQLAPTGERIPEAICP